MWTWDFSHALWKIQRDKNSEKHSILWDFILSKITLKHLSDFNYNLNLTWEKWLTEQKYLKILGKAEFWLASNDIIVNEMKAHKWTEIVESLSS